MILNQSLDCYQVVLFKYYSLATHVVFLLETYIIASDFLLRYLHVCLCRIHRDCLKPVCQIFASGACPSDVCSSSRIETIFFRVLVTSPRLATLSGIISARYILYYAMEGIFPSHSSAKIAKPSRTKGTVILRHFFWYTVMFHKR